MRPKKNGTFIDDDLFNDPDIQTPEHLGFAVMCESRRDIIGVVPASVRTAAPICRLSNRKFRSVVDYFEHLNRVMKSLTWDKNGGRIWWKSGMFYGLMKGNPTEKQKTSCIDCILKWNFSGVFPPNFLKVATQLVVNQHRVKFSSALLNELNLNEMNLTEMRLQNATTTVTPKIPESDDPLKDFLAWRKTEEAKERINTLMVNYGLSEGMVDAEFEKVRAIAIASPKEVARSVAERHDGDWGSYFGRWLIRARNDHHRRTK